MTAYTVRLPCVDGGRPDSAKGVDPHGHGIEVPRVDAQSVPAQVVQDQTLGDFAHKAFVRPAMRQYDVVIQSERPVAPGTSASNPFPAVAMLDNLVPEPFLWRVSTVGFVLHESPGRWRSRYPVVVLPTPASAVTWGVTPVYIARDSGQPAHDTPPRAARTSTTARFHPHDTTSSGPYLSHSGWLLKACSTAAMVSRAASARARWALHEHGVTAEIAAALSFCLRSPSRQSRSAWASSAISARDWSIWAASTFASSRSVSAVSSAARRDATRPDQAVDAVSTSTDQASSFSPASASRALAAMPEESVTTSQPFRWEVDRLVDEHLCRLRGVLLQRVEP
jgi:hypothetical protein